MPPTLHALSTCRHIFGNLGHVSFFDSSLSDYRSIPISYDSNIESLPLPRLLYRTLHTHERYIPPLQFFPVCNYGDEEIGELLTSFGFPPSVIGHTSAPKTLSGLLIEAIRFPVKTMSDSGKEEREEGGEREGKKERNKEDVKERERKWTEYLPPSSFAESIAHNLTLHLNTDIKCGGLTTAREHLSTSDVSDLEVICSRWKWSLVTAINQPVSGSFRPSSIYTPSRVEILKTEISPVRTYTCSDCLLQEWYTKETREREEKGKEKREEEGGEEVEKGHSGSFSLSLSPDLERQIYSSAPSLMIPTTQLIEETLRVRIPMAGKVVKAVMAPVMKPLGNLAIQETAAHAMEPMSQMMSETANALVPPHVATMLAETVPYNVSNIITDTVTARLTADLTQSLSSVAAPYLVKTVSEALVPRLSTAVKVFADEGIYDHILRGTPVSIERSLKFQLLHSLTRALTHSVVASVAPSLVPNNDETEKFCYSCYWYKRRCEMCHWSPVSQYYYSYHSAYYSDYYSMYYAEYYGKAVEMVDKWEFPHYDRHHQLYLFDEMVEVTSPYAEKKELEAFIDSKVA